MTRLPHENRDVAGLDQSDGPQYIKYKVGPLCSVPGCSRLADHSHHIWRRSFVIGDKPWVRLWDGTITGNLTGLCFRHHTEVTENRAHIRWSGVYVWDGEMGDNVHSVTGALLEPQPPILRPGATEYEVTPPKLGAEIPIVVNENLRVGEEHFHGPGGVEKCPTCHRAMARTRERQEGPRHRERWSVTVPVDERENGAEVLDTLTEECQKIFGHDETKQTRYFTIVQALALVVQNQEKLLADG